MARFSVPHPNCNRKCKEFEVKKPLAEQDMDSVKKDARCVRHGSNTKEFGALAAIIG